VYNIKKREYLHIPTSAFIFIEDIPALFVVLTAITIGYLCRVAVFMVNSVCLPFKERHKDIEVGKEQTEKFSSLSSKNMSGLSSWASSCHRRG
jgi:hypothetical protein